MRNRKPQAKWLAAVLIFLVAGAAHVSAEGFESLTPEVDIIYLLANSSVILGPDVEGPAEDLTFTGTVWVPKFPQEGFDRRQVDGGRTQIDFELTRSELRGESYLMNGTVILGEHPDLRSLGTITQREGGVDYPADFIVQRKVLIETPNGTMYNEDPVPVRGTIDSIPPVRVEAHAHGGTQADLNVFRGEELPVALLDLEGSVAGYFYSRVHVAYAVHPEAIYRMPVAGSLRLEIGGREEEVWVEGPVEMIDKIGAADTEIVMMALRGESELLEGPIMITETFHHEEKVSAGHLDSEGGFDLYLQIKSPAGILEVEEKVAVEGSASKRMQIDEVSLGENRPVPVYYVGFQQAGDARVPIFDEAGREVGVLKGLSFAAERMAGRRPCCPIDPTKTR